MIIKTFTGAQLANRLYDLSTFIVYSIEKKQHLYYTDFEEYKGYFAFSDQDFEKRNGKKNFTVNGYKNLIPFFRKSHKVINKFIGNKLPFLFSSVPTDSVDLNLINDSRAIMLFGGMWFKDYPKFTKHEDYLRKCFELRSPYKENVTNLINNARKNFDIIIGIHIRRGDYLQFQDGKYFYDDDVYLDKINQAKKVFSKKGTIGFLICSNEKINFENFESQNTLKSTGHFVEDLYSLSACDYIIGPPSTFTMWASFYSNTPLSQLYVPQQEIKESDFIVFKVY